MNDKIKENIQTSMLGCKVRCLLFVVFKSVSLKALNTNECDANG